MGYIKLTKAQHKMRERIEAWMKNEPFRENSKSKPAVPVLETQDILEQYIPTYASDTGSFFTPLEMGWELFSHASVGEGDRVLDPCAGIGHLLYPISGWEGIEVHAWELAMEQHDVGKRLFPNYHWRQRSAYEIIPEYEGYFDVVLMNPPFGITWATSAYESALVSKATKSEHMMLEVALRALKPGGRVYAIAPYNFIDKIPKACRTWMDSRMANITGYGELTGKFELTNIRVHGWEIERVAAPDDLPAVTTLPDLEQKPMFSPAPEPPEQAVTGGNGAKPIHAPIDHPKHAIAVPIAIYEAFRVLDREDYLLSPKQTASRLKQLGEKDAATWVLANSIAYGNGYFNGFYSDGQELIVLSEPA